jgi:hypothetical protein
LWQTVGLWSLLLAIPIILFDTTLQALWKSLMPEWAP